MVYKQKVMNLLESLEAKLRLIENVANGTMKMDSTQVNQLIQQTKIIRDQISELVRIERD